VRRESQ